MVWDKNNFTLAGISIEQDYLGLEQPNDNNSLKFFDHFPSPAGILTESKIICAELS